MNVLPRALLALILLAGAAAPVRAGTRIAFDYSYDTTGFFADGSDARATLLAAADFYEDILLDDLSAISPGGGIFNPNSWTANFTNPSTGTSASRSNLSVPADTLTVFVGAHDLDDNAIGSAGPGGYSLGFLASSSFRTTVTTRGEGTTTGGGANDFGPWGGSLAIDNVVNWNRDYTATTSSDQLDLYSVVLHELGHVFGYGTSDSWENKVSGGQFIGAESVAEHGVSVPLSEEEAHWATTVRSEVYPRGNSQKTLLGPSISYGSRKHATELDIAGLADIGWEIAALPDPAAVLGRHVFYNNSAFDTAGDAAAIATDKTALLLGEAATLENYTSYSKGINGIIVDVDALYAPEEISAADFEYRVGNDDDVEDWSLTTSPSVDVSVGGGVGGSDRITLIWPDGAIRDEWLEVTVKATRATWLDEEDVFYFGNAVGETGNSTANALVSSADLIGARDHPRGEKNPARVTDPFDVNRDGFVDALDVTVIRGAVDSPFSSLRLITPSVSPAPAPTPVPEPSGGVLLLLGLSVIILKRRQVVSC